ncbi:3-oxoacyl-ACP synthase [Desulfovirgula thermocuniculi]|uniref:3-oxoacyl-ACP synthase n=1 Tax=Desulfovirgula thermocuniculi TaxID=348842 RepID=UPI000401815C|nr:3-oxoacyl-ACP synthase [Desulfovirgula thermocuniculi]
MASVTVGIRSTGVYLPERYMTSADIARESGIPQEIIEKKLGFYRKPVPGPDDHTIEMGIRAARAALAKGGVDPDEIDLVIYIGEEYKEHLLQTGAIKLQGGIGAKRAWAFDVQLRCGTMVMALKVARDLMLADDKLNTVLLAGGYRNGDLIDYRNPRVRFMYNLGAGGAAVVLQKNWKRNTVLGGKIITDPLLADCVGVTAGGTKVPMTREALEKGLYTLDVFDPEGMKARLDEVSMPNFLRVIREAVEESGYTVKDIGYLCILHMKRSAHEYILSQLGLPPEKAIYLEEYGHIGQIDQVLSLELALERGLVKDGDLVVMTSAGVGYAWAATVIKWGPEN